MIEFGIDGEVRQQGSEPFLAVWTVDGAASPNAPALAQALRRVCEDAAVPGALPQAEAATELYRAALQQLGRNPNRYRISSDALRRRCQRDGVVPSILPLVDLNNIMSLRTGWPIGCYDAAKITGGVTLRLGLADETMATLGKGDFDIGRLPVLTDGEGPFGSAVSDSVRSAVTGATATAQFVVYGYGEPQESALCAMIQAACEEAGITIIEPPRLIRGL